MSIEQIVDFAQAGTAAEHYRPAAEKVLKGDPEQSVRNHYGSPCGQFSSGIWEGAVGQWTVNYTEHEYCEILQGVSVLRDAEGNAKTVRAGDRFYVQNPATGRQTAVTIEAKDTLQSLARKIELASGRHLKVTIKTDRDYLTGMDGDTRVTSGGVQRLSIISADGRAGPSRRASRIRVRVSSERAWPSRDNAET